MSPRYLIECSCGEKIGVGAGQAGQQVRCGCGRSVDVPLLRELRALPTVAAPEAGRAEAPRTARSTLRTRLVFFGLLGTILGLLLCGVLAFARSKIDRSWSHEGQRDYDGQVIDSMPADVVYTAWQEMRREGLGDQQPASYMLSRRSHAALGRMLLWTLAFSVACGLFTVATSLFKPPSPRQERSR